MAGAARAEAPRSRRHGRCGRLAAPGVALAADGGSAGAAGRAHAVDPGHTGVAAGRTRPRPGDPGRWRRPAATRWPSLRALPLPVSASASGAAAALLVLGWLAVVVGRSQAVLSLEVLGLLPCAMAVLLLHRGWPALRLLALPLGALLFVVPLPGVWVQAVTLPLKLADRQVAESAAARCRLPGGAQRCGAGRRPVPAAGRPTPAPGWRRCSRSKPWGCCTCVARPAARATPRWPCCWCRWLLWPTWCVCSCWCW